MIILEKLQWDNCFSYGEDNSIDLSDNKLTQIIGSNGVGKSSIPLILEEILYNKNSKGVKKGDVPNRLYGEGYRINLSFTKDNDKYELSYIRKSTAKVTLIKNGEDISGHTATHTYTTLQEILGLDFKTFSQLVYQSNTSSLQFLTATDTARKKFLIDLFSLESYTDLFDVFKNEAKLVNDNINKLNGQLDSNKLWLANNSGNLQYLEPVETPEQDISLFDKAKNLESSLKTIETTNKKINSNNQYKKLIKEIDIQAAKNYIANNSKPDYSELQSELGKIENIISSCNATIRKIGTVRDTCHTCGQPIDSSHQKALVKEEEDKKAEATKAQKEIQEALNRAKVLEREYIKAENQVKEWEELFRSIDNNLPSELLNKTAIKEELDRVLLDIDLNRKEIERCNAHNAKVVAHNSKVDLVKQQISEIETNIILIDEKIKVNEKTLASLEILKKAFSTNGLIAYKIENLVKDLESLTNNYLADLSDGRFTLQFIITNDKLNVSITDNGNAIDIMVLSSGELARVNTATLLAIRKLMSSISKSEINVLFLDEVINVLDEQGRERLVEVLLEENLNTFLVSHGWSHPLLEKIEVVKNNNISRLEVS